MLLKIISAVLCLAFFIYELVSMIKTIKQRRTGSSSDNVSDTVADNSNNSDKGVNQ